MIREAATRLLAGESVRSICTALNDRGERTVTGGRVDAADLRRMLASARISGQREHRGMIVGRRSGRASSRRPIRSGSVRSSAIQPGVRTRPLAATCWPGCSVAAAAARHLSPARPLPGHAGTSARPARASAAAAGSTISAEHVEHAITEAVLFRLDSPELAASLQGRSDDPAAAEWQAEADRAQAQLDELATAYAEQLIGLQEWLTARGAIEQRLQAARKKLATLNRVTALDGYLGNASELRRSGLRCR